MKRKIENAVFISKSYFQAFARRFRCKNVYFFSFVLGNVYTLWLENDFLHEKPSSQCVLSGVKSAAAECMGDGND